MNRQQFHAGYAEAEQVGDGRFMTQSGVSPAQLGRHAGMTHGEALDVHLVDNRVCVGVPGVGTVLPRE